MSLSRISDKVTAGKAKRAGNFRINLITDEAEMWRLYLIFIS